MTYDTIIIGGGPGGAAAAVYAARKQLKTIIITPEFGGQSVVSEDIQNWIGTPHISGASLAASLKTHVKEYEGEWLTIREGVRVDHIEKKDNLFTTTLSDGSTVEGTSILITAGSNRRKLDAIGADTFEHKGLTYCASCDGPLFSDMDVLVVGGGNAAFETAAQLLAYCKSVTLVNRTEHFRADEITVETVKKHPNFSIINNAIVKEVLGDGFVNGAIITHTDTGVDEQLSVSGIFVEIGQIANGHFLKNIVAIDDGGKIIIDPWTQRTSTLGIWAAGDITNIRYHQNNIAAGDAVKAIEDLYLWIKTGK
jgi:alkyl hydroperoxide reductase subunit F